MPLNPRATNLFSPAYDLRDPTWRQEPSIAISLRFPFGFPSAVWASQILDRRNVGGRPFPGIHNKRSHQRPGAVPCDELGWSASPKRQTETSTWAKKTINQLFASNETSLLLKLQPPTNSEKCGDFAHGFLRTGEVAANPSSVTPEPAVPASNKDRTVFFSRANTANTFSDIVESFPVFVSVSFGELGKQCRNRVFQKKHPASFFVQWAGSGFGV